MRIVGDYLENVQAIICALNVTVKTFIVLQRSLSCTLMRGLGSSSLLQVL